VGIRDILDFQVGKGEEMRSIESSHLQELTYEEEAEGRPHSEEDSCGVVSHVNEDDKKLRTSTIKEKDKRTILIIGGFKIFILSSQGEAIIDVADVIGGKKDETVMGEKEQILMSIPTEGEFPIELLIQWELELRALEDWLDGLGLEVGCQEIAMEEETH
jgi:hypothetical protein